MHRANCLTTHGLLSCKVSAINDLTLCRESMRAYEADMNVRITAKEMAKLGRSSIKLGDGSGDSLASLGKTDVPLYFTY